ncbi:hypothetical protein AURDEDRAFT_164221 [Auricularia subglabra TFB-10046 SS5]|nr:hypothetical protein AURDEDRAFT_164221 [Auricularia subglabra TFB-10046 SS5]
MAEHPRLTSQGRTEPRQYFTARDDDQPSPPPSRPRSRSLPVSGYVGALARNAAAQAAVDTDTAQDAMVVDDASTQPNNQRLPLDVLTLVLEAWMAEESSNPYSGWRKVPFYALQICGSWREAAEVTHTLWQRPDFSFRKMLNNPHWVEYHACFSRYGGTRGFDVSLSNNVVVVPPSDPVWAHFRDTILVNARTIDLEIFSKDADRDILAGLAFPLLRTLQVRNTTLEADYPDIKLFMRAPELRHLELDKTYMAFDDLANREANPLWSLTSLEVSRPQYTVEDLCMMSGVCIALRELSITIDALHGFVYQPAAWTSLETLHVNAANIYNGGQIPAGLGLPNLKTLEIKDNKRYWPFWRHFIEVSCPALRRLCVYRNHMDHGKHFVDGMGALSQVRELVFRDGSLNEDIIALLVLGPPMPFPNVRSVHFENAVSLRGFVFKLMQIALQHRYAFLRDRGMPGPFTLTCELKRKLDNKEEDQHRASAERTVLEYNEEEWQRFQMHGRSQ